MLSVTDLVDLAREHGLPEARVVFARDLSGRLDSAFLPRVRKKKILRTLAENSVFPEAQENKGTFLVCAYPCYSKKESEIPSAPGGDYGCLASFAAGNFYRESVGRLKKVRAEVARVSGLKSSGIRIFCNSRLPEKILAVLSGLGFLARNSLVVNPRLGTMFVISGLYIPLMATGASSDMLDLNPLCHKCNRCAAACPSGAIDEYACVSLDRCLQARAGVPVMLSDGDKEIWGRRIYGCQICQDVCPYNSSLACGEGTDLGWLGRHVALDQLLIPDYSALRQYFRKTALALSWIDLRAIKRNALIACGHALSPRLLPLVEPYLEDENDFIRDAAGWAWRRIRGDQH